MKIKNIVLVVISNLFIFCTATSIKSSGNSIVSTSVDTDVNVNHKQSQSLIERYNNIQTDTILDNVCAKIIQNRKFRNANNSFNEDSIRNLMFSSGITDYQYELIELNDVDTLKEFSNFISNDRFANLRMGYMKNGNNHILLKTKRYLKFEYSEARCYSDATDIMKNKYLKKSIILNIKTDTVKYFVKPIINDDYYYQFSNKIPLVVNNTPYGLKRKGERFNLDKLVFFANNEQESNMFLIILNKNGLIVTILK